MLKSTFQPKGMESIFQHFCIGIHFEDELANDSNNWKGENLLGQALDMVYNELSTIPENKNVKML